MKPALYRLRCQGARWQVVRDYDDENGERQTERFYLCAGGSLADVRARVSYFRAQGLFELPAPEFRGPYTMASYGAHF